MGLFDELADNVEAVIVGPYKRELLKYNMTMRGTLLASLEVVPTDSGLDVMVAKHGVILNKGVTPARIPYTVPPPYSGAKHSKYIEGLATWFKIKHGVTNPKRALGLAFGLARKHKLKGLPLNRSKIGWLDRVQAKAEPDIQNEIEYFFEQKLEQKFIDHVNKL